MSYFPIIIVDTETTGLLDSPYVRMIEIGAVMLDAKGREIASFSSLIKPNLVDRLDPCVMEAMRINRITWDQLEVAPRSGDVRAAFTRWCALLFPRVAITSYRLSFDSEIIQRAWPGFSEMGSPFAAYCIREEMRMLYKGHPDRFHLRMILADLNLFTPEPAHRALADARAASMLLHWIDAQEEANGSAAPGK